MRSTKNHTVDAHTYAALLDGCSRMGKCKLAFELVDEMLADKVVPNNLVISALFRMAGYSRLPWVLTRAFSLCDNFTENYNVRLNAHTYMNMLHACASNAEPARAVVMLGKAAAANHRFDGATYEAILVAVAANPEMRGHVASMLRLACGVLVPVGEIPTALRSARPERLQAHDGFGVKRVESVLLAIAKTDHSLSVRLARDLERETKLQFDNRLKLHLASATK
jgi:pentatricopeptide repeat protein